MLKLVLITIGLILQVSAEDCETFYENRGSSITTLEEAYNCFQTKVQSPSATKDSKAYGLNKMSYLKFFEGIYYGNSPEKKLIKSFELAKEAILLYGEMNDRSILNTLKKSQIQEVALSYYLFGTSVSKYVDLKGKWEAIKRMSEIKNSMKMILSLREPSTYHYGAFRTLGIFNMRVPSIAGGSLPRSKMFFERLINASTNNNGVMTYPVGHLYYAEYFWITDQKESACLQLEKLLNLDEEEIKVNHFDLYYETLNDKVLAQRLYDKYRC